MNFKSNKLISCAHVGICEKEAMHAKLCKYGESNRLRLFPFWMLRFYLIFSSETQIFSFFFWYSKLYVHGKSKTRNTNFFTTFIITY